MEINITPHLSKENFWNETQLTFPNATRYFLEWIDAYKAAIGWDTLFPGLKFHDMPYAVQVGIWIEYNTQRGGCEWKIENMLEFDLETDILGTFQHLLEE